ncbi:YbgC/FadM family acyl-CoA thioesterase [Helicobacter cetorum]|uniref:acyl-CoA thioesterase YbgC n=1 Tax=Helicobacter cetorum TaxID=138563 RepID=UPI000CF09EB9|nr:YbgC/FadM family acyl-CoA thioesterase [Helicobacter cetorum]
MRCRVYYEDTDAQGVVYHANYLKYCERARSEEFFKRALVPENSEGFFVIRSLKADFFTPASLGQVLEIKTQVKELKKVSVVLLQEIYCVCSSDLKELEPFKIFALEIKLGFVHRIKHNPIPIPITFKEFLDELR